MNIKFFYLFILLVQSTYVFAQQYPEAPEKWSMPVKVKELNNYGTWHVSLDPSLTPDGKVLYYYYGSDSAKGGIYKSVWCDTVWSNPERVQGEFNEGLVECPSISPDGKRIYFRNYGLSVSYGDWDLYYSDWDSVSKTWGPAINMGPNINDEYAEWTCMTPDNKHMYWAKFLGGPLLSTWKDSIGVWSKPQKINDYHTFSVYGRLSMPANQRKMYYDTYVYDSSISWQTLDIIVHYYDTLSGQWGNAMTLNLNELLDTTVTVGVDTTYPWGPEEPREEFQPWISADGRTLYFVSTHDGLMDIWMSNLVIDENGDSVVDGIKDRIGNMPIGFKLFQNYPNPFNPATQISYQISVLSHVTLKVYDVLGREIATLVNTKQNSGTYTVNFDASRLSSGIYFYRLATSAYSAVRKMAVIK